MASSPSFHPRRRVTPFLALAAFLATSLQAADPKAPGTLDERAFVRSELKISTSHVPLEKVMGALPNRAAWEELLRTSGSARGPRGEQPLTVYLDPRSGAATNILGAFPLVPGKGVGNRVTLASLGEGLGRPVDKLDGRTVGEVFRRFTLRHRAALRIDAQQLGDVRATQVSPELWQIHVPQVYQGIPVRDARLAGSINNGNLVVVGTEVWGDVKDLDVAPRVGADEALEAGFAFVDGRRASDVLEREPTLEIVPVAPLEPQSDEAFAGPLGSGYEHWLVWTFVFRRAFDQGRWEVMVDAHSGEVVALQDINHYGDVKGGVYPLTNTEVCPDPERCGAMQTGTPMPFANTGLAAPNNFTTSAGLYDSAAGNAVTTLAGKYIRVLDNCGAISVGSGSPTVDLGGTNGQHDCTSAGPGFSLGDTSSSRSSFYELNRIAELARGWLPTNTWLQSQLTANVNIVDTCNAYWDGSTVNFFRSGGGCRNTGEIAAVFDHEWGHGLDDNDAAGVLSNSSEAYADVAAIYRLNASCVGYGFFWTSNKGCGQTSDGTGYNQNENQVGGSHCDLDCSGVRDADWNKHSDHQPDTALGFVCGQCASGSGPCGRQVHCAATPARQAAWDLVARDLQAAPYNLDAQTALIVGNRLFYQGSGNIGLWHSCSCGVSSDGCGATNGYMQWLTADDDNGNLADGTPHMTAIYNAFNRHGIACNSPAPQTSGCAGGPTEAPSLTATPGVGQNQLAWTTVGGATKYRVFRADGPASCDLGKTVVAEVTGAAYTDSAVANGREYSYNVMAVGSSAACASPASACVTATPTAGPEFTIACSPSSLSFPVGGGSRTSTCTVTSVVGFTGEVALDCSNLPAGASCGYAPASVTLPANGSVTSTLTVTTTATTPTGTQSFQARGVSGPMTRTFGMSLSVPVPNFTLACSPSTLTVPLGSSGSAACTVTAVNGFTTAVNLGCTGLPAGASCGYSPNPVSPPGDGTVQSTLVVTVGSTTSPGSYTVLATGTSAGLTRTFSFTLGIPDFTLACSPPGFSIPFGGGSRTSSCTVTSIRGFAGAVSLDCTNLPAGASCSYAPPTVAVPANGNATSTLTFTTTAATPAGGYTFQARGVSGSRAQAVNMTLSVAPPDFSLTCIGLPKIPRGSGTGSGSCSVAPTGGFVAPTTLSCSNLPSGATCSFNPNPVIPPATGSVSSALTVSITPEVAPGNYPFQVTATGGSRTHTLTLTLNISDFTLSCNPAVLAIAPGGSDTSACTLGAIGGFSSSTSLSCIDPIPGITCGFSPNPVVPTATSTLTVTLGAGVPAGSYEILVQAIGDSLTRIVPVTVQTRGMTASFDPPLKAPKCGTVTSLCDSGTLLVGRDGKGPEVNQPNTIGGSCLDGTGGTFHVDESNDQITVSTLDGGRFAAGKTVKIAARVWAYSGFSTDHLDLYAAGNGSNPVWTYLTTLTPTAAGAQTLSANYTLPVGALQAVRARFRWQGSPVPCGNPAGTFDDHDDLVFAVNRPPVANAGGPRLARPDHTVTFDGSGSSDMDGDALTYTWDFGDGTTGSGSTPTHTYTSAGEYTVTLVVNDGEESSAPATTLASIGNHAPVAQAGGAYGGVRNEPIAFVGTGSSDPDGDALTYAWDFGDGATGTGPTPTHAYTSLGNHTVTLVVSDGDATSAPSTTTATISNRIPVANAGPPRTSVRNSPVSFDGTGSSDPDGDELAYVWDFGDGAMGSGATPPHAYASLGSFTVTLVVNDGTADSAPATTTVAIENQAPVAATGGPYAAFRNYQITFNAAGSSDADGDPLTYQWTFGDGTTGSGATPTHAYTSLGTFTLTLVVNDGTADSLPATTTVTIENQRPIAVAGGPHTAVRHQVITFNGSDSSDPDGDPLTYQWSFGDGATGSGPTPTHAFASLGSFTMTLVVNDGTTDSVPSWASVTIENLPPVATLTSPPSGTVVTAPSSVALVASADDPDGTIARVEFFAGAAKVGESTTAPYSTTWTTAVPGAYLLTARATDESGTSTTSVPVSVLVNAPPQATLTSPASDAVFAAPASVTLTATASDADGQVVRVEFYQGTTLLGSDETAPYAWTVASLPTGTYAFTARAIDDRGASTTSAAAVVMVESHRPPAADAYVRDGSSNAGKNFGTATTLVVKKGSSGSNRWSYLRFDTSVLPSVSRVRLRLFGRLSGTTSTVVTTSVYPAANVTWGETQITWNNKPASGTTALASTVMNNQTTTERWYEWDVTTYVQQEKAGGRHVVTLVLKNDANSSPTDNFRSREATSQKPELVLTP
jgi:PKD repeat protein